MCLENVVHYDKLLVIFVIWIKTYAKWINLSTGRLQMGLSAYPVADSESVWERCLKTIIIYILVLDLEQDWILCIRTWFDCEK